jgi:hypothetical protein
VHVLYLDDNALGSKHVAVTIKLYCIWNKLYVQCLLYRQYRNNKNRTLLPPVIPNSLQVYFHLTLYRVFLLLLHWTLLHECIESVHLLGHTVTGAVLRIAIKEALYFVHVFTNMKRSTGIVHFWTPWKNKFGAVHASWTDCVYRAYVQYISQ